MDYADMRSPGDPTDKRIDLPKAIREAMDDADRTAFRVVAFTHRDTDHILGASDFFWFDHATKYQGTGRPKINELWVPASAITESSLGDDARVIRQEA